MPVATLAEAVMKFQGNLSASADQYLKSPSWARWAGTNTFNTIFSWVSLYLK